MGADFIDYIIADRIIVPFDRQSCYSENIVHLPVSFMVNDFGRVIAGRAPTRGEAGLPDHGIVFCCFNNHAKIAAPVFATWMRLLQAIDGSVVWLSRASDAVIHNLRVAAAAHGIDPARLVFASRTAHLADHLARHRLADMFLDTLPYNAHATASDALWAGLPVVTCAGRSLAGRVAASLVEAVGLADLVTHDLWQYEALALRLAHDHTALAGVKARLAQNRTTSPLFDTNLFRRHIEAAYATMWERWQRGERPRGFAVEPCRGAIETG
jgi:predicted O-linked N-acetylglucosamine transferase (SPINDLY family)